MELSVKANPTWHSIGWITYFFLSIAIIGVVFAYVLSFPLYVLGRFHKPTIRLADFILHKGIFLLMAVQPWFNAEIDLTLPPGPYKNGLLIVANHRSHLDAFILLSRIPGLRFIGHRHLFFNPFIGPMIWAMGSIPASKSLNGFWHSMELLEKKLRQGEIVCVFPELTRCEPGLKGIQEMTSAPFLAATKAETLLLPVVFSHTDQIWPKGKIAINSGHPIKVQSLNPTPTGPQTSAIKLRDQVALQFQELLT